MVTTCVVLKDRELISRLLDLFCVDCGISLNGRKYDAQTDFKFRNRFYSLIFQVQIGLFALLIALKRNKKTPLI